MVATLPLIVPEDSLTYRFKLADESPDLLRDLQEMLRESIFYPNIRTHLEVIVSKRSTADRLGPNFEPRLKAQYICCGGRIGSTVTLRILEEEPANAF